MTIFLIIIIQNVYLFKTILFSVLDIIFTQSVHNKCITLLLNDNEFCGKFKIFYLYYIAYKRENILMMFLINL